MTQPSDPAQLWVVAQTLSEDCRRWELGGVFSTREKAIEVCTQPNDAVFPVTLDHFLGRESVEIPAFWPVPGPISAGWVPGQTDATSEPFRAQGA